MDLETVTRGLGVSTRDAETNEGERMIAGQILIRLVLCAIREETSFCGGKPSKIRGGQTPKMGLRRGGSSNRHRKRGEKGSGHTDPSTYGAFGSGKREPS